MAEQQEHTHDEGNHPDPPPNDPPKGDPKPPEDKGGKGDDDKGGKGGAGGTGDDSLKEQVKGWVKEALSELRPGAGTSRTADVEAHAEELVRKASEKLENEKAHKAEHEAMAAKLKKEAETVPKKVRRSTKLMWGGDDE